MTTRAARLGWCAAGLLLAAATGLGCPGPAFRGPLRLLAHPTVKGALPPAGRLVCGGETRPALLATAAFDVPLPARPLLTYGLGATWAGSGEAPGWIELVLRAGGRELDRRRLNPRALHAFREWSLELVGLGRRTRLEFELRYADREGRSLPQPPGLVMGVADPTLHDLDQYGRARGVLLVSIDTLRRDHVGAYGYTRPTTPTLDALAARGFVADDAVSVSSWTLPAHLSLLTSVEPGTHGGTRSEQAFNRRVPTLPELLRAAGHATQAVTSHLYVSSVYGLDAGFDTLDFRQDRKAAETADKALALLDRVGDRPFFLFLHFYDPHWHYDPPAAQRALFDSGYRGPLTGLWQDFKNRSRESLGPGELQHLLDLYDGEIRYTDDELGRVLRHLRSRGLEDSTLVLVTSDHGEEFLEHGSWEHQKTLYEEVVRVPLVFAAPGVPRQRYAPQASLLDVAPTILAWAGVPVPASMQGRNLLRSATDVEAYGETDHTAERLPKLFVRGGAQRWKAIFDLDAQGRRVLKEEWYDLAADPGEQRSHAPRADVADAIRERALRRWHESRARGGRTTSVHLSPEQRESLRGLGYLP